MDGLGANTPPSLSNIHDFGAQRRFKCFFGPRCNKNSHISDKIHIFYNKLNQTAQQALYNTKFGVEYK